jgi:hypothetical protein
MLRTAKGGTVAAAAEEAPDSSCEPAPKRPASRHGGWYSRPRKDPALVRKNGDQILSGKEFMPRMIDAPHGLYVDHHGAGNTDRSVIPLDAEAS